MMCKKCFYKGEYIKFDTFAYWYCKRCKIEIPEKAKMKEINLLDPLTPPEGHIGYPTEQEINDFDWGALTGQPSGIQLDDPDAPDNDWATDGYDTKSTFQENLTRTKLRYEYYCSCTRKDLMFRGCRCTPVEK